MDNGGKVLSFDDAQKKYGHGIDTLIWVADCWMPCGFDKNYVEFHEPLGVQWRMPNRLFLDNIKSHWMQMWENTLTDHPHPFDFMLVVTPEMIRQCEIWLKDKWRRFHPSLVGLIPLNSLVFDDREYKYIFDSFSRGCILFLKRNDVNLKMIKENLDNE